MYTRKGIYSIEEVFTLLDTTDEIIIVDGDEVKVDSIRYQTFKEKGLVCSNPHCGLVGRYFAKEINLKAEGCRYHFNLYAIDIRNYNQSCEVLMTRDHIFPTGFGGRDSIENSQTMCFKCNQHKANAIESSNIHIDLIKRPILEKISPLLIKDKTVNIAHILRASGVIK
jgi:hypothetical protein